MGTIIAPPIIAAQVLAQGGSAQQAWVAAALANGIESNGDPTDQNPTSTACGLFQFLDTTWAANGGTKYSSTACGATWQQQITVFLNASQGNNFYPWSPDLGGSYNGVPIYAPLPGSAVANGITSLASTGTLTSVLGAPPASWPTGAATTLDAAPVGQPVTPTPVISLPLVGTILNSAQAQEILGSMLIGLGGLAMIVGLGLILSDLGLHSKVGALAVGFAGGEVTAGSRAKQAAGPAASTAKPPAPKKEPPKSVPGTGRSGSQEKALNQTRNQGRASGEPKPANRTAEYDQAMADIDAGR